MKLFCTVLSIAGASEISGVVSQTFPTYMFRLRKWFGMEKADDFQRLVCCDTCYRVYPDDDSMRNTPPCGQKTGGIRTCYGDIVEGGKVKTCNAVLYDCIHKDDGTTEYTPKHIYCYKPLSKSLDAILARPGVLDMCNKWRTRQATPREYSDIHDGSVWKRFVHNGFLREQTSLALQLNLDWFQPFTCRNNISIGAIYIAILNLPQEERYKIENVILLGIIPNLTKEPSNLEYFLRPLVEELKTRNTSSKFRPGHPLCFDLRYM